MKRRNYIDRVYYVFFNTYFLLCAEMALLVILLNARAAYFWLGLVIMLIVGIICYFFYARDYDFSDDAIIVKVGFITKEIPYRSITNCYITRNNRLSYATSVKRIGLTLEGKKNDIYISPEQMDEILVLLRKTSGTEKEEKKVVKKTNKPKSAAPKRATSSAKTTSAKKSVNSAKPKTQTKKTAGAKKGASNKTKGTKK